MSRIKAASRAALVHLLLSIVSAGAVIWLVLRNWYPPPFAQLSGGNDIIALIVSIDVVLGPVMTLVIFSPAKNKGELARDLGLIAIVQLLALSYGVWTAAYARPVLVGYEGDRFRLVARADIDDDELVRSGYTLSWEGPKAIGVRLLGPSDAEFKNSILQALQGIHPSFRPERWVPYAQQASDAGARARPVAELARRYPEFRGSVLGKTLQEVGKNPNLGYMPLISRHKDDAWVALLDRSSGEILGYLPLDGW